MRTFGHTAFEAGVKRVTRKERDEPRLSVKPAVLLVLFAHCHEAWEASDRFCAGWIDMVDIIVMQNPKVWRITTVKATGRVCNPRLCSGLNLSHFGAGVREGL